jgi:hypothetical protein
MRLRVSDCRRKTEKLEDKEEVLKEIKLDTYLYKHNAVTYYFSMLDFSSWRMAFLL